MWCGLLGCSRLLTGYSSQPWLTVMLTACRTMWHHVGDMCVERRVPLFKPLLPPWIWEWWFTFSVNNGSAMHVLAAQLEHGASPAQPGASWSCCTVTIHTCCCPACRPCRQALDRGAAAADRRKQRRDEKELLDELVPRATGGTREARVGCAARCVLINFGDRGMVAPV